MCQKMHHITTETSDILENIIHGKFSHKCTKFSIWNAPILIFIPIKWIVLSENYAGKITMLTKEQMTIDDRDEALFTGSNQSHSVHTYKVLNYPLLDAGKFFTGFPRDNIANKKGGPRGLKMI